MKLSDAIMLGSATCRLIPQDMNSCAYGCALNAMGVAQDPVLLGSFRWHDIKRLWPWTMEQGTSIMNPLACTVWSKFDGEVCSGEMTLEQLADYVRSIEPACECCKFGCDCATKKVEEVQAEYVTTT